MLGFYILGSCMGLCLGVLLWGGRHIVHSMLAFMGLSAALAGLYLWIGAAFVGGVQLMVYVGGVLVLLAYGIMLSADEELQPRRKGSISIALLNIGWAGSLVYAWQGLSFVPGGVSSEAHTLTQLGLLLMGTHGLILELVGLLLLVVLVGVVRLLAYAPKEQRYG